MRFAALLVTLLAAQAAHAKLRCSQITTEVAGLAMSSSRSASFDGDNRTQSYDFVIYYFDLTDANTSITRFDSTCTVSFDGNVTDYTPQDCTAGATCTSTAAGVWQKASPGSAKWSWRLDLKGYPDHECTFSVGTGSGAAADPLTVRRQMCAEE
jgi:hypothetical protein